MKYIAAILLPLLLLAFSCENKESGLDIPEEQILGKWDWQYSIYYQTQSGVPYILNPDTLGYFIQHTYDENGEFSMMRNDQTIGRGTYWFERANPADSATSIDRLFIQQDNYIKSVGFVFSGDTLILDESGSDGPRRIFIKVR